MEGHLRFFLWTLTVCGTLYGLVTSQLCVLDPCDRGQFCSEGTYAGDPEDCGRYWWCVYSQWTSHQCGSGQMFDIESCRCLPTATCANCTGTAPEVTKQPGICVDVPEACAEGMRYPDVSDCQFYYLCTNASLTRHQCQVLDDDCQTPGLPCVFDIHTSQCIHPGDDFDCDYRCLTTVTHQPTHTSESQETSATPTHKDTVQLTAVMSTTNQKIYSETTLLPTTTIETDLDTTLLPTTTIETDLDTTLLSTATIDTDLETTFIPTTKKETDLDTTEMSTTSIDVDPDTTMLLTTSSVNMTSFTTTSDPVTVQSTTQTLTIADNVSSDNLVTKLITNATTLVTEVNNTTATPVTSVINATDTLVTKIKNTSGFSTDIMITRNTFTEEATKSTDTMTSEGLTDTFSPQEVSVTDGFATATHMSDDGTRLSDIVDEYTSPMSTTSDPEDTGLSLAITMTTVCFLILLLITTVIFCCCRHHHRSPDGSDHSFEKGMTSQTHKEIKLPSTAMWGEMNVPLARSISEVTLKPEGRWFPYSLSNPGYDSTRTRASLSFVMNPAYEGLHDLHGAEHLPSVDSSNKWLHSSLASSGYDSS